MDIKFMIKCGDLEEYISVQKVLFEVGYKWFAGGQRLLYSNLSEFPILVYCYNDNVMLHSSFEDSEFNNIFMESGVLYEYNKFIRRIKLERLCGVSSVVFGE